MSNNHYLAFTIGPIYKTLIKARKTRELWAASYIFSLLMRRLLEQLQQQGYSPMLPNTIGVDMNESPHGAGIWPDRCVVEISNGQLADVKQLLQATFSAIQKDLKITASINLSELFVVHVLDADWRKVPISTGANGKDEDCIPIHRINRILDNLELAAPYQAIENTTLTNVLGESIHDLYDVAGYNKSEVFIQLSDRSVRLPSLPEIALQDLKYHADFGEIYQDIVEKKLNEEVVKMRSKEGRAKDLSGQKDDEQFYLDLKKAYKPHTDITKKSILKMRHKYVAVVVADGNFLGRTITQISKGERSGTIQDFSKNLQAFAADAVQKIVDYHGLPVYAGGDDLLFIAPVSCSKDNVIALCKRLDEAFKKQMGDQSVSLSFGVSISYYKHPLGEALASAYELEKQAKAQQIIYKQDKPADPKAEWKPRKEKNALSFQVQKHSGQQFGATLWLGSPESTELFLKLLEEDKDLDEAFLTSAMHKLQELPSLLADAARHKRLEAFQKHHFNEGGKHDKEYLKKALQLAEKVFDEYGDTLSQKAIEAMEDNPLFSERKSDKLDLHHTNIAFAALRLKQFLIQEDHD